ncbi:hypothetical protein C2845_PM10G12030 [Panicum miliaceum]|uniref:Uncharacterized protein n=1 Tax=Panicum miliaceum TaxID=4540 RepID=A0A3L6PGB1_PANMI|nr:hypothetical protein C2845_PM10G12030 [Panicum miliaceum]
MYEQMLQLYPDERRQKKFPSSQAWPLLILIDLYQKLRVAQSIYISLAHTAYISGIRAIALCCH